MRFDTRLVHIGQQASPGTGAAVPPIHVATTYERRVQDPPRYFYARGEHPTREGLEDCLAALEDARFATVYASGQAAGMTALCGLSPGQTVLASDDVYGGTYSLFGVLSRYGIRIRQVDLADPAARDAALAAAGPDLGAVWIETPTNPMLKVTDIGEVSRRAHALGAFVVVDNTFASPALQQPLAHGADVSLYSTTKFIAGHLDAIGGALVTDDARLHEGFLRYRTTAGNVPGGFDCFLIHRGLKTLSLRIQRQVESAERIVAALRREPSVGALYYPGLPEHPQREVAARQMAGPGSMISFEYRGDAHKLMDRLRVFVCAVSLGAVQSLVECPAGMTHWGVPKRQRERLGITDNLVRLSIGIEDPADLVDDLLAALRARE
ncbi:trans-sulfuration enzyme family protein [Phytohabitans suffuscus]|uniref:homocysteine desulfhydrase n=1 Tax=Phytohabitans suffuscus TaxID=624315 RepID=A0A6F8YR13_9ACTN|nr:PLP-dependent aspartate aminotransferase family protein [Phytohabitans suffuscus]BCB88534.1 cystathionine gamma-synthase [Phytohabitans suffuscus]